MQDNLGILHKYTKNKELEKISSLLYDFEKDTFVKNKEEYSISRVEIISIGSNNTIDVSLTVYSILRNNISRGDIFEDIPKNDFFAIFNFSDIVYHILIPTDNDMIDLVRNYSKIIEVLQKVEDKS